MSTVVGTRRMTIGDMSGAPSRSSGPQRINEFNAWMKTQPWYQQFFASIGQDMNRVQLSRSQQSQLERLMQANGVPLGRGVHIDDAGNLNEKNRLGRNVAIGAGITLGSIMGAPHLGALFGGGGGASGAAGAAAATEAGIFGTPAAMASNASWLGPLAGGAGGGGGAAATGIGMRQILQSAITPTIGAASNYFSNRAASNSARDAAELESASMAEQLQFLREQEEQRRREHEATEQRNYGIYTDERDYSRGLESQRQARLEPYRRFALGSIGHLSRPMRNVAQRA